MIRPPGMEGVAFGTAADGDGRDHPGARRRISARLGIPEAWALVRQVHGAAVLRAAEPGHLGEGDALFTDRPMLPLCVATADCLPVAIEGDCGVGLAHAGWRGTALGVVPALRAAMVSAGIEPRRAAVGPGIGPCCFEVGEEVVEEFPEFVAKTRWGSRSVDLPAVLQSQLEGLPTWDASVCTQCDPSYHSYRRDATAERQVAVAWLSST